MLRLCVVCVCVPFSSHPPPSPPRAPRRTAPGPTVAAAAVALTTRAPQAPRRAAPGPTAALDILVRTAPRLAFLVSSVPRLVILVRSVPRLVILVRSVPTCHLLCYFYQHFPTTLHAQLQGKDASACLSSPASYKVVLGRRSGSRLLERWTAT